MKLNLVLMAGLFLGCAPWTYAWSLPSGHSQPSELAASILDGALIHSPFPLSPPRPSDRDDILETLGSGEEEDYYSDVRPGGVASLTSSTTYCTSYCSFHLLPRRQEAVTLRQRSPSWLLC